jgi:hemerythrin-like domain-containing protein
MMSGPTDTYAGRRSFLRQTGIAITGAALMFPIGQSVQAEQKEKSDETESDKILPTEDLMREHGVLSRILLVYDNLRGRLSSGGELPKEALSTATGLMRGFIENYHEKLEEEHVFPRFERAGILADLVQVLRAQHKAGRRLTEFIKRYAESANVTEPSKRKELGEKLGLFTRMYRPHAAREDTVLFPALRSILSPEDFDVMGEEFEDKEQALFGVGGFERIVEQVADLERSLDVYDLAKFTPDKQ